MAQQTATEWLIEQLKLLETGKAEWFNETSTINKALRMEKEQIINAFRVGDDCGHRFALTEDTQQFNSGEQYYNETYNK